MKMVRLISYRSIYGCNYTHGPSTSNEPSCTHARRIHTSIEVENRSANRKFVWPPSSSEGVVTSFSAMTNFRVSSGYPRFNVTAAGVGWCSKLCFVGFSTSAFISMFPKVDLVRMGGNSLLTGATRGRLTDIHTHIGHSPGELVPSKKLLTRKVEFEL